MQRTKFGDMACSISCTLDVIGEPWSPLILRDVCVGTDRFDKIRADLGISRKVLSERLRWLVESGVLERRQYETHPPRYEYVLTPRGTELVDLLIVMVAWGDRWADGGAGPGVLYRHHACGQISHVELRCSHCGAPMRAGDVELLPGPAPPHDPRRARPLSPLVSLVSRGTDGDDRESGGAVTPPDNPWRRRGSGRPAAMAASCSPTSCGGVVALVAHRRDLGPYEAGRRRSHDV